MSDERASNRSQMIVVTIYRLIGLSDTHIQNINDYTNTLYIAFIFIHHIGRISNQ